MGKPRLTQEEFLRRAKKVHGDFYDYSEAVYENQNKNITIICPKHGSFPQTPKRHTAQGSGCPACGSEKAAASRRLDPTALIEDFKKVHGDKYDYSQVVYESANKNIVVVCPEHGPFQQTPERHKQGRGCRRCKGITLKRSGEAFKSRKKVAPGVYYGQLRVEGPAPVPEGSKERRWNVICSCGFGPYSIGESALRGGHSTRCKACGRKEKHKTQRRQFMERLMSSKTTRLTPLRDWGTAKKNKVEQIVLCQCSCGNQWIGLARAIMYPPFTQSCGCLKAEHLGGDCLARFLNDKEWAESPCFFYLARVKGGLLKPGIAVKTSERKWQGAYEHYEFISPELKRCEAWAIEQAILVESSADSQGIAEPIRYGGTTEVREETSERPAEWYAQRFQELQAKVEKEGWEALVRSLPPSPWR